MELNGKRLVRLSTSLLVLSLFAAAASQPELQLWPVDALVKVFPEETPGAARPAVVEVARGEHASFRQPN